MSVVELRRPLVLCATRGALADAARLLPHGVVLENVVTDAIAAGALRRRRGAGDETTVRLCEHGVLVVVERTTSPTTGRAAWKPCGVRPDNRNGGKT